VVIWVICRPAEENGITRRCQLFKAGCIDFLYPQNVTLGNSVIRVPFLRSGGEKIVLIRSPCFLYFLEFQVWMVWRNVMKSRVFALLGAYACCQSGSSNPRRNSTWIAWIVDGTDRLYRNVSNYQSTPRNIPEERRSHLQPGGSLNLLNLVRILCHKIPPQRHTSLYPTISNDKLTGAWTCETGKTTPSIFVSEAK
jgi:hypothetical protein